MLLYQEEQKDGNEVDSEPDDCSSKTSIELYPLVIGLNDVNINKTPMIKANGFLMMISVLSISYLVLMIHLKLRM